jgi:hypothetical protein
LGELVARRAAGLPIARDQKTVNQPVHLIVERPARISRLHLVIRLVLLLALGALGVSSVYWALYLALPPLLALAILQKGGGRYLAEDAPRLVKALHWFAAAYGYLWLLTDVLPSVREAGPVDLKIEVAKAPTATAALWRLITSLPALVLVVALTVVGTLLWLVGALSVLATERLPVPIADFLALALRVQFRFLAYHLSLVDRYPSWGEAAPAHAHGPTAA